MNKSQDRKARAYAAGARDAIKELMDWYNKSPTFVSPYTLGQNAERILREKFPMPQPIGKDDDAA